MNTENIKEIENFYETVNLLQTLLKNNDAEFYFSAGVPAIKGDIAKRKEILNSIDFNEEHFDKSIREILTLIPYVLSEKDTKLLDFGREDPNGILRDKCNIINKKLISRKLREKFILENTYKTNLIDKFDWSIITKYYDSEIDYIDNLYVAQLRFRIRHPFSETPNVDKTETFVVECDIYDINEIIEQLNKIKRYLVEMGNKKQGRGEE